MIIKLHNKESKCCYINVDCISQFMIDNGLTRMFEKGTEDYWEIKESPEDILALIQSAKESEVEFASRALETTFLDALQRYDKRGFSK